MSISRADCRSCSVRTLSGRVKRRPCRDATYLFRARGSIHSLRSIFPSDSEPMASENALREPVRAALRHEPFFKALAALGGHEGERDWRALTAGLVTLRVADRRLACVEDCGGLHPGPEPTRGLGAGVPSDVIEAARAAADSVDRRDVVASPLR